MSEISIDGMLAFSGAVFVGSMVVYGVSAGIAYDRANTNYSISQAKTDVREMGLSEVTYEEKDIVVNGLTNKCSWKDAARYEFSAINETDQKMAVTVCVTSGGTPTFISENVER